MGIQRLKRLTLLVCALPLALSACVTVDLKDKSTITSSNPTSDIEAVSIDDAMRYLQASRQQYIKRARTLEGVDALTRAGVGVAVAGAGVSATLEHHAAKKAGKYLTFGAVSYIANQNVNPVAISRIYRAGATNLECIRGAAIAAKADVTVIRDDLKAQTTLASDLQVAIDRVQSDVDAINALQPSGKTDTYIAPVENAIVAVRNARAMRRSLLRFSKDNGDGLGEQILSGVNGTRQVVNDQALKQTPTVEAILQSGAVFARFIKTGGAFAGDVKAARDSLGTAFGGMSGVQANDATDPLAQLKRDELALSAVLAKIPDLSLASDFAAIAQCQTILAVLKPVTIAPSPIKALIGGEAVKLTITGQPPFTAYGLPADVLYDRAETTITAGAKAKAKTYKLHFVDALGVDSGDVDLTLEAKPATPPASSTTPTPGATDTTKTPVSGGPPAGPGHGASSTTTTTTSTTTGDGKKGG